MSSAISSKVERIKWELGLDPAMPLVKAIAHANETTNLTATGTLPEQVDRLVAMLSV